MSSKGQPRVPPDKTEIPLDKLIEDHLILSGSVSGIAVLTPTGTCVYSYGKLADQNDQCWTQFTEIFTDTSEKAIEAVPKVVLPLDKRDVPFVVFKKTLSSVYATSEGNLYRLIVCSCRLGVLVCVSEPPIPFSKAITAVENVCSLLRM